MSTPMACRTCCKKERTKHIPVDVIDQNGLPIADMIYQITDIMVTLDSHLPQQICPACLEELRLAHNFRQKCINSNTTLSRQIAKPSGVLMLKEEYYDPELEAEEVNLYNMFETEVEKPVQSPQEAGVCLNRSTGPTASQAAKRKDRTERTLSSIANDHIRLVNNRYACAIKDDVDCGYAQKRLEYYNFVRHFRTKHRTAARKLGMLVDPEEEPAAKPEKIPRIISKQAIEIDAKHLIEASIKLVTFHNLPLECFEWDGFRSIYKPLMEPLGLVINGEAIARCIRSTVGLMSAQIREEMSSRLLSILVDSAVRHGRHVLTVSSQFELDNVVETRVLGIIWVKPGQTAKQLKLKVELILNQYELTSGQIFAIIVEHGTNVLTTAKKLHKSFWDTARDNVGEDTADGTEMDKLDELLEALSAELRDQFNVIRGPIRNLHLALNAVLPDTDPNLFRFNRFAWDLRDTKYDDFFQGTEKSFPPICTGNRWTSKYKLIRSIFKRKHLLTILAQHNPEVALHDHEWQYVQEFNEAFQPLYAIMKRMQKKHHPFSEFYMQWLMAIKELRSKTSNRFSKPLTESLTKRVTLLRENSAFKACMYLDTRFNYCESVVFSLEQRDEMKVALNESDWKFLRDYNDAFLPLHEMMELVQQEHPPTFSEFYMRWLLAIKVVRGKTDNQFSAPLVESLTRRLVALKENMVYKAALYLDPRFNYLRSVVFTAEQKEEVQNYIISIWNRIQNIRPGMAAETADAAGTKQEDTKDDMDDFLTEMFGGPSSEGSSKSLPVPLTSSVTPILHQLKSLEIEPRQAHTFDVWKHWLQRAGSHPDLFSVAMVVLSLPSNNVNLERAFSALVLSDRRDGLSEENLEELLLVRLNRNLFEKVVLQMGDWKQVLGS